MFLADISIKRPVFMAMVTIAIALLGWISYSRMPVDLFPDVSIPVIAVQTVYPGATPEEMETLVTKPIELAVSSLGRVADVRSSSSESVSLVVIEFEMEHSSKEAADDVRQRVAQVKSTLPSDAHEPSVFRFDPAAAPILSIAVSDRQGALDPYLLRKKVEEDVVPKLERVSGIAGVTLVGGLEREIQVDLSLDRLQALSLPVQQVVSAIQGENVNIPGGRLPEGERERLLRVAGQFTSVDEIADVPVVTPLGATVYLRDIADVVDGYKEVRSKTRLNGRDGLVIFVRKQSGTNTVAVAEEVKKRLQEVEIENPGLELAVMDDQSTFTRESTVDVLFTLVFGGILAALVVLFFFRSVRNTIVTVAGLPVIVLGTFWIMASLGFSLNMITLLALSLSIGMLVDDAIVVRENIFRHTEEGLPPREAASRATGEIALAVTATTLTIVVVFAPIAFTSGIAGKFLREFGLVVVFAVMLSLFEAFTLAPLLSAHFFKPTRRDLATAARQRGAYGELDRSYRLGLAWALRHRRLVVVAALVSFAGSMLLLDSLERSFVRDFDRGDLTINLEMAPGTNLAEIDAIAREVEALIMQRPEVAHVLSTVGATDGAVEKASLKVKLVGRGLLDTFQRNIRPELEQIPRVRFDVDLQSNSLSGMVSSVASNVRGRPLQLIVQGGDLDDLDVASQTVAAAISQIPGVVDIDRSLKPGRPEVRVVVDRARAADLGISTAQIGLTARALVSGERASLYADGDESIDIMVRLREADRSSIASVETLPLLSPRGRVVPLSAVATLESGVGPARIDRLNRQREVTVGASYFGRELGEVVNEARREIDRLELPAGVTVAFGGTTRYMEDAFSSLLQAAALSIVFVYMILASQFGSFIHPFTIMLALPLSLFGAFAALRLTGLSLDMVSLIGMILLMGLVTKNSILLVDYTNTLRARGYERNAAILAAGPVRLRPILMTTISTICGMLPIAVGFGAGGEVRQPMAIAVIGGFITSTVLTLVVVPVAYTLMDDLGRWLRRGKGDATYAQAVPAMAAGEAPSLVGGSENNEAKPVG
jgi:hydrophobic/amphiphilic exporter-1 (mainly G- bacteria), HAE1 family